MTAPLVPVSQATGVRVSALTPTTVTLVWKAPAVGTPPIGYTVFYRRRGAERWAVGATASVTTATVERLSPSTVYELEVFSHNW